MSRMDTTDERVLELIEAYGASSMSWPEDEREAAEAHLAAHPARFEAALAAARALDSLFDADMAPEPGPLLAERILASAPRPASQRHSGLAARIGRVLAPNGRRWPAGAALASLGMGLFAGYTASASSLPPAYETEAENVVYGALGYDQFDTYLEEEMLDE